MSVTKEEIEAKLAELGDTPLSVYRGLRHEGIKGKRGQNESCPIANYLQREFDLPLVRVQYVRGCAETIKAPEFSYSIDRQEEQWAEWRKHLVSFTLTDAVQEFIKKFDGGGYPSLLSE